MGDESIQKSISKGGGGKTPPQEKPEDESANGQHNNMTSPSGDESGKPKPVKIVLVFAAFEAGGYVFSEIADGLGGYIAVFVHFISLSCAAAGFFAAWHEIAEGKKAFNIWSLFGIVCVCLAFIAYLVWHPHSPMPTTDDESKPNVPNVIATPELDYIEGTKVTEHQIKEAFPFGYVIFRMGDAKWIYEPDPDMHWKINADYSKIKITPDFANRKVEWAIPHFSIYFPIKPDNSDIYNCSITNDFVCWTVPMEVGKAYPVKLIEFGKEPEPDIFLGTIGDNQLHPVFVLGFRIRQKIN